MHGPDESRFLDCVWYTQLCRRSRCSKQNKHPQRLKMYSILQSFRAFSVEVPPPCFCMERAECCMSQKGQKSSTKLLVTQVFTVFFLLPFSHGLCGQQNKIPRNSHLNTSFLFMLSACFYIFAVENQPSRVATEQCKHRLQVGTEL